MLCGRPGIFPKTSESSAYEKETLDILSSAPLENCRAPAETRKAPPQRGDWTPPSARDAPRISSPHAGQEEKRSPLKSFGASGLPNLPPPSEPRETRHGSRGHRLSPYEFLGIAQDPDNALQMDPLVPPVKETEFFHPPQELGLFSNDNLDMEIDCVDTPPFWHQKCQICVVRWRGVLICVIPPPSRKIWQIPSFVPETNQPHHPFMGEGRVMSREILQVRIFAEFVVGEVNIHQFSGNKFPHDRRF